MTKVKLLRFKTQRPQEQTCQFQAFLSMKCRGEEGQTESREQKMMDLQQLWCLPRALVFAPWALLPQTRINTENCEGCKTKGEKKKKKEQFFAHDNFVDRLLNYTHFTIWEDSSFYLNNHQDRNSNKALLTSAPKVTLFSEPFLNFCLIRKQINPVKLSLGNFRKRRSVVSAHFSFGWLS